MTTANKQSKQRSYRVLDTTNDKFNDFYECVNERMKSLAIARKSYKSRNEKELTVRAGEVFEVLDDDGLWWCLRAPSGNTGHVHKSNLELIKNPHNQTSTPKKENHEPVVVNVPVIIKPAMEKEEFADAGLISMRQKRDNYIADKENQKIDNYVPISIRDMHKRSEKQPNIKKVSYSSSNSDDSESLYEYKQKKNKQKNKISTSKSRKNKKNNINHECCHANCGGQNGYNFPWSNSNQNMSMNNSNNYLPNNPINSQPNQQNGFLSQNQPNYIQPQLNQTTPSSVQQVAPVVSNDKQPAPIVIVLDSPNQDSQEPAQLESSYADNNEQPCISIMMTPCGQYAYPYNVGLQYQPQPMEMNTHNPIQWPCPQYY